MGTSASQVWGEEALTVLPFRPAGAPASFGGFDAAWVLTYSFVSYVQIIWMVLMYSKSVLCSLWTTVLGSGEVL